MIVEETDSLTLRFAGLTPQERLEALFRLVPQEQVLFTSSFGSTSAVLLHLLSRVRPGMPVHFVDTGFHFPETLAYKELLAGRLGLRLIDVGADARRHRFTRENETWRYNPDLCCYINKVYPVDRLKGDYKVWISGLLGFQNPQRQQKTLFEKKGDILKLHPILDMSQQEVLLYLKVWDLPLHPLLAQGYESIGCTHCTARGQGRSGRWMDSTKTECGLHV
ncbi:phosphoadenylyl-sulfate reductase [Cesiribacter andamanensis]|uniref:Adenosine 5'-phosphosulfate reductase n=1 Tax=Cesiribacter andamanensis AMV16 TaxID=1279009 RepID=M7N2P8_9BACT|nr:phosphoadenylyl-sulfate reductase [Cesiribacter andamanensis]EMR02948.1 Phosphoadenosine phosphosulfate reductase [Cesiribacter andamanensis AMV16]